MFIFLNDIQETVIKANFEHFCLQAWLSIHKFDFRLRDIQMR